MGLTNTSAAGSSPTDKRSGLENFQEENTVDTALDQGSGSSSDTFPEETESLEHQGCAHRTSPALSTAMESPSGKNVNSKDINLVDTPTVTPEGKSEKTVIAKPSSNKPSTPSTARASAPVEGAAVQESSAVKADKSYDSSSDDESSYFRDNLPDPKSDRRYSSAPRRPHTNGRESDASLSFSEDSEDGHHPQRNIPHPDPLLIAQNVSPLMQQHRMVPEMLAQMIPPLQQDALDENADDDLSSDPGVRDELKNVAMEHERGTPQAVSGRLSPILGEHAPSRGGAIFLGSPSSFNPEPSPPTIMAHYQQVGSFPYPQPFPVAYDPQQQPQVWMDEQPLEHQQQQVVDPFETGEDLNNSREVNLEYSEDSMNDYPQAPGMTAPRKGLGKPDLRGLSDNRVPNSTHISGEGDSDSRQASRVVSGDTNSGNAGMMDSGGAEHHENSQGFQVYWKRWLMLFYMSILNLLVSLISLVVSSVQ